MEELVPREWAVVHAVRRNCPAFFGPPVLVAVWNQRLTVSAPSGADVGGPEDLGATDVQTTASAGVDFGNLLFTSTVVTNVAVAGADVGAAEALNAQQIETEAATGVDFGASEPTVQLTVLALAEVGVELSTRFDGYGSPEELAERSGLYLLDTAFAGHPECGWSPGAFAVFSLDQAVPLPCDLEDVPSMVLDRDSFLVYLPPVVPTLGAGGQRAARESCIPRRNPEKQTIGPGSDPTLPDPTEWTAPFVVGDWEELEAFSIEVQTRTAVTETELLAFSRVKSYSSCGALIHVSGETSNKESDVGEC